MATYSRVAAGSAFQTVLTSTFATGSGSGLTSVVLNLSDGTELLISGVGFTLSGGLLQAGTIQSLTHRGAGGGATIETMTGLSFSAIVFQSFLSSQPPNGTGLYDVLMQADDNVFGSAGADSLIGSTGSDFFRGGAGNDTLNGGDGNDMASYDNDAILGGTGGVIVNMWSIAVSVLGFNVAAGTARDGFGNTDTLVSMEEARGTAQTDVFYGGTGYSWQQGRGGADTYVGGSSAAFRDNYSGGAYQYALGSPFFAGNYWVDYRQDGGGAGINITLNDGAGATTSGTGTDTHGATETFININNIRGSMLADTILGNNYFNQFQGLQGNDTINGRGGYDVIDYSRDAQFGGGGAINANLVTGFVTDGWGNTDTVSNVENVFGSGGNDSLVGNAWDNGLRGFNGNDTLIGGDGFDDLRPGLGTDLVNGAAGPNGDQSHDDRDRVTYSDLAPDGAGLGVIVNLSGSSILFEGHSVSASTARDTGGSIDTLIDIERVRGTTGRDYLVGSSSANLREERFEGWDGDDYIDGGAGFDIANYTAQLEFGGGTSGVIVNFSASSITVNGQTVAAGTVRDPHGKTDTLLNIEGIHGTFLNDHMVGSVGFDFFRGAGGADFFDGGAGDHDRISFFIDDLTHGTSGAGAVVDMTAGTATHWASPGATTTFINVEQVYGSERNDSITGNAAANLLFGDSGADTIRGGGGADTINGSAGADSLDGGADFDIVSYLFDPGEAAHNILQRPWDGTTPWTGVTVNLQTGTATDMTGAADTIAGFEGIAGTFLNDSLTGDTGDNLFHGLSGNDTITGGGGIDTVSYFGWGNPNDGSGVPVLVGINASRPFGVNVHLGAGTANDAEGGTDTLIGIRNVIGSTGNDTITGDLFANTLTGGLGNDTLTGGGGADMLIGGEGIDTVSYANAGAAIQAFLSTTLGAGQSDEAAGDLYVEIEGVIGSNFGDVLVGAGGLANVMSGGGGDDTIYGEGIDSVFGGSGIDTFFGGQGGSLNLDVAAAQLEVVWGSFLSDTINGASSTANLTLISQGVASDSLTGGSGDDFIYFRSGDTIAGGAGSDWAVATLSASAVNLNLGATGFENAWGSTGNDTLSAATSTSGVLIVGDTGNDLLTGSNFTDFIYGFAGADTLIGGGGNDVLSGGTEADHFVYNSAAFGTDLLYGFETGTDKINMAGSGVTAFNQLTINIVGGNTSITSAATGASQIFIVGVTGLTAGDFLF